MAQAQWGVWEQKSRNGTGHIHLFRNVIRKCHVENDPVKFKHVSLDYRLLTTFLAIIRKRKLNPLPIMQHLPFKPPQPLPLPNMPTQ